MDDYYFGGWCVGEGAVFSSAVEKIISNYKLIIAIAVSVIVSC
jgi:hypothetical protein